MWRYTYLILAGLLVVDCLADSDGSFSPSDTKPKNQRGPAMARYWRDIDGSVHKSEFSRELEPNILTDSIYPDKVQVVSSSLRILPRRNSRQKRSSWRTPREYQFVTREMPSTATDTDKNGSTRIARLVEGRRLANYYPEERSSYPVDDYYRGRNPGPNRRIIYYATLPEVVRRPGEWTPPRPIYNPETSSPGYTPGPGYPPVRENEITRVQSPFIDVTRVHSSLIDVSDKNRFPKPSIEVHAPELSTPKFTIIDAEPPYNRPPPPHHPRYDNQYDGDNRYDRHRYSSYGYNRYDYNRYYEDPYRPYLDDRRNRPSYLRQPLPAQPVTIYRKPLDVRPLDPNKEIKISSSTTTIKPVSSSSTTPDPISQFERNLRFNS
uniref:Uncharacterized protein n=1 Tax=Pristhesancus plagipennis TaxID=1955184 RepID=A0A2K8JMJ6_PRIPG|nr:secreted hypothetical protein [Pristhesancus plagipennis]